jgi:hypothetical protein
MSHLFLSEIGGGIGESRADKAVKASEIRINTRNDIASKCEAEEDRDQVRRHYADKAREKELLGTDAKVYNSDRLSDCLLRLSIE